MSTTTTPIRTAEKTRKTPTKREYAVDAFRADIAYVWEKTPFAGEIESMCLFRAIACSYKRSPVNVKLSRRLLFHYLTEFRAAEETDLINLMYKQLPVSNYIGKYIQNVCTAYKLAPKRSFGEKGNEDEIFTPIYEKARINRGFRRAHSLARLLNCVAVRPVVRKEKLYTDILTPDLFRVELDEDGEPAAVWYPIIVKGSTVLRRWTPEHIFDLDREDPRKVLHQEANPYGVLPFVFIRFQEEEDWYGGGDFDLVEQRMEANAQRFYANLSSKYESHGIMVGKNLGFKAGDEPSLPPGALINQNGLTGDPDGELPPSIEFISPQGQYMEVDQLRRDRVHETLRMKGVPNSMLNENTGLYPSGAAMMSERMELNDVKEEDTESLRVAEAEFKLLVAIVLNADMGENLPENDAISIDYQREPVVMEPKDEYELELKKVTDYVRPLTDLVNRYSGQQMTDAEAVKFYRKNRELWEKATATDKPQPSPLPNIALNGESPPGADDGALEGIRQAAGNEQSSTPQQTRKT